MPTTASRRIASVLGLLGALGPMATDMYLPGLPAIAADLAAGEGTVQFSVMSFFAGLTLGQLFYGPLSDRTGRKPMIYVGLLLFAIGSLGCAASFTAHALIAWRFVQGLGGSIGMVIGLAVVRDLYTGPAAARLVALMLMVLGIAPVLAPLGGWAILTIMPWPAIFVVLALFALGCLALVALALPETRLPELRASSHLADTLRHYLHLAVSRRFLPYVAASALAQAGFFAYVAGSSFVFISVHRLSPAAYSLLFAVNALGLSAGAQIGPRLLRRLRPQSIVRVALAVYLAAGLLLAALELAGTAGPLLLAALLFVVVATMGFVMPLCSVMALESYGAIAGTAAALMGACQFGAGVLAMLAVGLFANGSAMPMVVTITVAGLAACAVAFLAFPVAPASSLQGKGA